MNRLILIGNGFDLAHGLPTGYLSFIKWYLKQRIKCAIEGEPDDSMIQIDINRNYPDQHSWVNETDYWIERLFKKGGTLSKLGTAIYSNGLDEYPLIVKVTSPLLKRLLDHCLEKRWVDVESTFYTCLTSVLNIPGGPSHQEITLKELNSSMKYIISKLQEYLLSLDSPTAIDKYRDIIIGTIEKQDNAGAIFSPPVRPVIAKAPDETLMLNFNYTNTVGLYFKLPDSMQKIDVNFIHGKLSDEGNPIIFGFGDEVDQQYEQMENSKSIGWFEYIKSFWYLKTNNYRDLISFIDSNEYQVVVLGHSCGLSDRTMLQMIFQHENCRSIKLYYHGDKEKNNFKQTLHEVARHFKDKGLMRRRIVSEENSQRMPQYND